MVIFGEISRDSEKWPPRQATDGLTPTARRDFCNTWVNVAGKRLRLTAEGRWRLHLPGNRAC